MTGIASGADHAASPRVAQYTSIQVLRGLAALMVVFSHLPPALGLLDLDIPILSGGVDLFFVISGFVMVLSTQGRRHDPRAFLLTETIVLLAAIAVVTGADLSPWIAGPAVVIACIGVSLASYRFIEKPLLALSRTHHAGQRVRA